MHAEPERHDWTSTGTRFGSTLWPSAGTGPSKTIITVHVIYNSLHASRDFQTVGIQAGVRHNEYETTAQSVCTSMAVNRNRSGWTYAVQRQCQGSHSTDTCVQVCASQILHKQDSQTKDQPWSTLGAIHVYADRPSSSPGNAENPQIGLKVFWSEKYHQWSTCGPNYCCCFAAF